MGIFDFLTKGPQLKRIDAANMANCYQFITERIRTKRYRSRRRQSFRILFSKRSSNSSITSEQSVQILKYALFMFENHKDYLKVIFRREAFRKHMEEYGDPYVPSYNEINLKKMKVHFYLYLNSKTNL